MVNAHQSPNNLYLTEKMGLPNTMVSLVRAHLKKGKGGPCRMLSLGGVLISLMWALNQ